MKNINFKSFFTVTLMALAVMGCADKDFEDGKIQSVDNHGVDQNMISTAVTAASSSQFFAYAVDASASEAEYSLIPVVITSANPTSHDIHVTLVPALDTLDSYNTANGTSYVMPGDPGTPAFTLVDNGVVTIPAGKSVGYLKIKTTSADYFGSTSYAFAYRIASVKEGNPISGNNNFGIVALIPKNKYDGLYEFDILSSGWGGYGIADSAAFGDGHGDYGQFGFVTTSLTQNSISGASTGGLQPAFTKFLATKTAFGATGPVFVFDNTDKLVDVYNSVPPDSRNRAFSINPGAKAWENQYYPNGYAGSGVPTIIANYLMHQNTRPDQLFRIKMTYIGPRP
jgi:hypothetical protein